ncbi:MAG: hypothetical protein ABSG68_23090 [Thermoguttaceae bacterium]|jgi:hypothetical protein
MFGPAVLVGCLLLGQTGISNDDIKLEVKQLVRKLDSTKKDVREAAEARLLEIGLKRPGMLDLLPRPNQEGIAAEVLQRVARVRQQVQRAQAESAAEPSIVELPGGSLPVSKVLAELQKQTGNRIVDVRARFGHPVTDPVVRCPVGKTPFWQALDGILDQAGLSVYPFDQDGAIDVIARSEAQLPRSARAYYSGPFRVEPVRVVARRELRSSAYPSLVLTLEAAWEPRLRPISLKQRMGDVKVLDDRGNRLSPDDPQAESEALARHDAMAAEINIPLAFPAEPVKEMATVQGSFQAIVPGKVETFRFTDLAGAKNVEQRIAAATVTLEEVRKSGENVWEVRMKLRFDDAGDALESHRSWVLLNEAYLEENGKPIAFDSSETTQRTKNEIGMAYLFALDKPPSKKLAFVYKTPGMVVTRAFPYEFHHVKLP